MNTPLRNCLMLGNNNAILFYRSSFSINAMHFFILKNSDKQEKMECYRGLFYLPRTAGRRRDPG